MKTKIEVSEVPFQIEGDYKKYELKVPYTVVDEYGNEGNFFRKEVVIKEHLEFQFNDNLAHIARIQKENDEIQEKLNALK